MRNRNNAVGSLAGHEGQASDKYQRIIEAGIKVFARKGFHNARVSEIASEAGVVRPEISPGIFKRALFGALDEISLHRVLRKKGREYLETSAEQLCGIFLRGLLKEGIKL